MRSLRSSATVNSGTSVGPPTVISAPMSVERVVTTPSKGAMICLNASSACSRSTLALADADQGGLGGQIAVLVVGVLLRDGVLGQELVPAGGGDLRRDAGWPRRWRGRPSPGPAAGRGRACRSRPAPGRPSPGRRCRRSSSSDSRSPARGSARCGRPGRRRAGPGSPAPTPFTDDHLHDRDGLRRRSSWSPAGRRGPGSPARGRRRRRPRRATATPIVFR